jgi:hypothetical protein
MLPGGLMVRFGILSRNNPEWEWLTCSLEEQWLGILVEDGTLPLLSLAFSVTLGLAWCRHIASRQPHDSWRTARAGHFLGDSPSYGLRTGERRSSQMALSCLVQGQS